MALHGYAGHVLHIDMSARRSAAIPVEKSKRWGGGHGLGSALFWDFCKDKTIKDGRNPANVCCVCTSPLSGTIVPSATGRCEVVGVAVGQYRRTGTRAPASAAASRRCSSSPGGTRSSSPARRTSRRGWTFATTRSRSTMPPTCGAKTPGPPSTDLGEAGTRPRREGGMAGAPRKAPATSRARRHRSPRCSASGRRASTRRPTAA